MRLKIRRSVIACLLALMLALGVLPARPIRAEDAAASRHDMTYVNAVDVDIWEDGNSLYVKHNGVQRKLTPGTNVYKMKDYLVTVETYREADGEQVTVVYFNVVLEHWSDFFHLSVDATSSDGSVYRNIYLDSTSSLYNSNNAYIYYVTIKGDEISNFVHARTVYGNNGMTSSANGRLQSDTAYAEHSGRIYQTPFLQNKYKVYCSKPVYTDDAGTELLIPETPLPAASRTGDGDSDLPYKTTFRMLTNGATVYNTFYYTSCYLASADEINASGKIRMDATKLADGTVHRAMLSAPQLLCQISSYGTAYDIVYTNDDDLCALLGISKPSPKYWDVASQQWKSEGSGGEFSPLENLSVKMVGDKGLIDGARYNDYYVYGETSSSLDFKLDDVDVDVWGLGNYLSWNYSGKLYDTVSASGAGSFGNSRDNIRQLRIVARLELVINSETVTETCVLTGGDNGATLSPAAGDFKIPMYYLQQLLQVKRPGLDLKSQLKRVTYEITPFYYSKANAQYCYGETASVSLEFQSSMNNYNGGDWSGGVNDNWTESTGLLEWIKNVINTVAGSISWIGNLLSQGMGLFSQLGQIPAMLASVVPFIPAELWTIISFGILLYFAPAIVRGIRNLVIGGIK